jgi:hypothetical protein
MDKHLTMKVIDRIKFKSCFVLVEETGLSFFEALSIYPYSRFVFVQDTQ